MENDPARPALRFGVRITGRAQPGLRNLPRNYIYCASQSMGFCIKGLKASSAACYATNIANKRSRGRKRDRGDCYARQRFLHIILVHFPTTASSAQFYLLCCQPEPIPGALAARMSRLTSRDPCRLLVWLGWAIHIMCRTWRIHRHSRSKFS